MTLRDDRLRITGCRELRTTGTGPVQREAMTAATLSFLRGLWAHAGGPGEGSGLALAATGSLARGDGGPLSDLDLVLLHDGRTPDGRLSGLADALWYPLWDSGLGLDHSVRTPAQCRTTAGADLTAAVGLLDLVPVAGDPTLVPAVTTQVARDWRADARRRLPELLDGVRTRHQRFGDLAQTLQPDLKDARGGLRDMTLLRALTAAWLTDRPRGAVDEAYATLLDVRDALHVVTGRPRNRLTAEDQDAVAALLGLPDADALLTRVSSAGRTLAHALDGTARRAGQSRDARRLRPSPRRPSLVPLGHGIHVHEGEVVLGPGVRADDPFVALRAAVAAARAELPVAPQTALNLATSFPGLPEPWPAGARELFTDLLAAGPGLVGVWEDLDQAGLISRWLPEWDGVRSRPQRGGVHVHTVDRHTLEALVNAARLAREVSRADLLVLAVLLHDIGKVAGSRDHSRDGVPIARRVLDRIGLPAGDADLVCLLVAEHLTLVELATRRDPTDPATVEALLAAVGHDAATLDLLRAVTIADAQAAGEKAWTRWRSALVAQLVDSARARLSGESAAGPPEVRLPQEAREPLGAGKPFIACARDGAASTLTVVAPDRPGLFADTAGVLAAARLRVRSAVIHTVGTGAEAVAVDEWVVTADDGTEPDVRALTRSLARLSAGDRTPLAPLDRGRSRGVFARLTASSRAVSGAPGQSRVLVLPDAGTSATVLEVRAADRPRLLHDLGRALAGIGVSVRSAHVGTHAGQTLDTFYVIDADGRPLAPAAVARAVSALIDACDGEET